ncbi:hypothetical protein CAPTEDRAFT_188240 [Capitella teleta]|uniref:Uncharacterized protein n=1 Tax=Capitella teleta TaxID=283909 RepID=R7T3U0_CAPTE|nr:hypothetical protein CAPTEDRAFT_188240 [Capitella teleta]|eukprot:ELT87423.1 hypothetical protein CAPTEDRAFT_188240 [Capitella teleta]
MSGSIIIRCLGAEGVVFRNLLLLVDFTGFRRYRKEAPVHTDENSPLFWYIHFTRFHMTSLGIPKMAHKARRVKKNSRQKGSFYSFVVPRVSVGSQMIADAYKPFIRAPEEVNSTIYQVANRTLLCLILNGTCMEDTRCHALQVGSLLKNQQVTEMPNFTCHDERTCCFHDDVILEESRDVPLKVVIDEIENKTLLCELVGGQCTDEDMCRILHVKNLLLGTKIIKEKAEFKCIGGKVCCFANKTQEVSSKQRNQLPAPISKSPKDNERKTTQDLLASLLGNTVRPLIVPNQWGRAVRRRPRFQRPWYKNSYDYDDYGDYNRGRHDQYDYYEYYSTPRAQRRHLPPPREPLSRLYRQRALPRRIRQTIRPKAGYAQKRPTRRYRPKVVKKVEYHDHNHGQSLLNHGVGGIYAKGFEDVFVSNLTAFCELYDGVCVTPGNCATQSARSYDRFQCNATTLCCLPDHSIKRLHPLGHKSDKTKTAGHKNQAKNLLLSHISPDNSELFTQTDRETLCELKNGACMHPSLCNSHEDHDHHGYEDLSHPGSNRNTYSSHHDFYCNLTTICCTPSLFDVQTHVEIIPYGQQNAGYH